MNTQTPLQNSLETQSSAYLRQHTLNPVAWQVWSEATLERARLEKKPIFLSIGYSTCHWCHVMEAESFSRPEIAKLLNENFIPIKLDREERPDLDALYMKAVQAMTGQGGWPLNVFLTPDLRPFFGGTYFPPEPRYGRPSFQELLEEMTKVYREQAEAVEKNASTLTNHLVQSSRFFRRGRLDTSPLFTNCLENLRRLFDPQYGGFGSEPKFFYTDGLRILLESSSSDREMVFSTLEKVGCGGIYDHLAGGFHRYSTDAQWLVPHFEKMLYDNALLIEIYTEAWKHSKKEFFKERVSGIVSWVLREMTHPEGGFYSAIDADTEHEEGRFYLWTEEELSRELTKEEQNLFAQCFRVHHHESLLSGGVLVRKFDGALPSGMEGVLEKLRSYRNSRLKPQIDRKRQVSWNALLIKSLTKAGFCFERSDWIEEARRAADCLWTKARVAGELRHVVYDDRVSEEGFLEDLAYFGEAQLELFLASAERVFLERAIEIAEEILKDFYDHDAGGFWSSRTQQGDLLFRQKEVHDSALPSPFSVTASLLSRLYLLTGRPEFYEAFERSVESVLGSAEDQCGGFNSLAGAIQRAKAASLLVAQNPAEQEEKQLRSLSLPWTDILVCRGSSTELQPLGLKPNPGEGPSYSWCRAGVCQTPQASLGRLLAGK